MFAECGMAINTLWNFDKMGTFTYLSNNMSWPTSKNNPKHCLALTICSEPETSQNIAFLKGEPRIPFLLATWIRRPCWTCTPKTFCCVISLGTILKSSNVPESSSTWDIPFHFIQVEMKIFEGRNWYSRILEGFSLMKGFQFYPSEVFNCYPNGRITAGRWRAWLDRKRWTEP